MKNVCKCKLKKLLKCIPTNVYCRNEFRGQIICTQFINKTGSKCPCRS